MSEVEADLRAALSRANHLIGEAADEAKRLQDDLDAALVDAARCRATLETYRQTHRWNVREDDEGALWVCKGEHDKALGCHEVRYVATDQTLSP